MKIRTFATLIAVSCLFTGCAHFTPKCCTKGETIALFDGSDLDQWYTFIRNRGRNTDPKGVFTVKDGLLVISGEEWGCITTHKEYKNYHLVTEFRWGPETHAPREDKTRDSGILLNSIGEDGGYSGIWMHSIECQIIEGGTGDFIVVGNGTDNYRLACEVADKKQGSSWIYKEGGTPQTINGGRINWWGRDPSWSDTIDFRGAQDVEKPVGEWNRLECLVVDGEITITLNGIVVNKSVDVFPRHGRIQVQSEGAEIHFRNITLHELPDV